MLVEGPSRCDPSRLRGRTTPQQGRQLRRSGFPRARSCRSRRILSATSQSMTGTESLLPRVSLMLPWPAPPLADDLIRLRPWRDDGWTGMGDCLRRSHVPALLGLGAGRTSPRSGSGGCEASRSSSRSSMPPTWRGGALPCMGSSKGGRGSAIGSCPQRGTAASRPARSALLARWAFDALGRRAAGTHLRTRQRRLAAGRRALRVHLRRRDARAPALQRQAPATPSCTHACCRTN